MKFLQKVFKNKELVRVTAKKDGRPYRIWKEVETPRREVYFLGYRTLKNGYINYYGHEAGNVFEHNETVKAALVINNKKENPYYVPIETIEIIDD